MSAITEPSARSPISSPTISTSNRSAASIVSSTPRLLRRAQPVAHRTVREGLDQLFRSDEFHTLLRHGDNRDSVQRIIRDSGQAHRQIADALVNGDPEAMQAAIGGHLADVERTIIDDLV